MPFSQWSAFEWSPRLPENDRLLPPTGFKVGPGIGAEEAFDALRIDIWGPDPSSYVSKFEPLLLAWIRYLTGQDWVGEYEAHSDSRAKYAFEIDSDGKAIASPRALLTGVGGYGSPMRPLDSALFQEAFHRALAGDSPPTYWSVWQDASMYRAMKRTKETVLALALSLEVARDTVFPRFAPTKAKPSLGQVLVSPFDKDDDLLKHLSWMLEKIHGRNLEKEKPEVWSGIKQLYIARHHVAHGRPPVFPTLSHLKNVDDQDLLRWINDVRSALQWIESL